MTTIIWMHDENSVFSCIQAPKSLILEMIDYGSFPSRYIFGKGNILMGMEGY